MNMLIKQLNITSFKGIKDLTLNLEGKQRHHLRQERHRENLYL